jgi:hypothetical protein
VIDDGGDLYPVLFDGRLKRELHAFRRDHRQDGADGHWPIVQRNKAFFWAVAEGAHALVRSIEAATPARQETTLPA